VAAELCQLAQNNVASNVASLVQPVSGTSVQEIDKLIAELQILRDMLQNEARVCNVKS
jgi:hypothetical protein